MSSRTVSIRPCFSFCTNYLNSEIPRESMPSKITCVIVPVRVKYYPDGTTEIVWRCNLGQSCDSPMCRYSRRALKE